MKEQQNVQQTMWDNVYIGTLWLFDWQYIGLYETRITMSTNKFFLRISTYNPTRNPTPDKQNITFRSIRNAFGNYGQ